MRLPAALALLLVAAAATGDDFANARRQMLQEIRATASYASAETGLARLSPQVMRAMARVPRHEFVPEQHRKVAYGNHPVPIGHGQTISQPYIVALMTELARVGPGSKVLEVGTGSAYQAAVLAALGVEVYTIEIVEPLATQAAARLEQLGYERVTVRHGDGYFGWAEAAPFDSIVVTAAASHVPPPLIAQLKAGGVMVIPVGERFSVQHLLLVEKSASGEVSTRSVLPVRFVPLTGGH